MKLVEEVVDDITVLEAYGRLDSTTAKEFGDRLNALVQAGQSSIVVDLKNIAKTEQARALRRDWRRRLFEIGDFIERFVICQTQADGIGQLRQ